MLDTQPLSCYILKKQVPLSISIRDAASLFFLIAQGGLFVKELELDIQLT
jgi:hypothetical protein